MKQRHVVDALERFQSEEEVPAQASTFIEIENPADEKGVAPIVKFTVQSDPIGEVGVNGCQAVDIIRYAKCLIESLNAKFSCNQNLDTIDALEDALAHQQDRTEDRIRRSIEGNNKA